MKNKIIDANRKSLYDYGWLIIFFAILDLIQTVIDGIIALINKDEFRKEFGELMAKNPNITETVITVALSLVIAVAAIIILVQVFLGVKAIKISKNPTTSKGHITLAKVVGVFCAIATFGAILELIDSTDIISDILALVVLLVDTFVMFAYARAAKKVRADALEAAAPVAEAE